MPPSPAAAAETNAKPAAAPLTPQQQAEVMGRIQGALFEALPGLKTKEMVELLEFIATQHSGSNFQPDNQSKALEIAAFCRDNEFPVSRQGVAALARLARHALGSSTGDSATSTEHQLWLLASGALNTAAAIYAHDGDPIACFEAIRKDGGVRGRYMQRSFAQAAMADHLKEPNVALPPPGPAPAPEPEVVKPGQLFVTAFMLFLAVISAVMMVSDSALYELTVWVFGWFERSREDPAQAPYVMSQEKAAPPVPDVREL